MWLYLLGVLYLIGYVRHVITYYLLFTNPDVKFYAKTQKQRDHIDKYKGANSTHLCVSVLTGLIWPKYIWLNFKSGLRGWKLIKIHNHGHVNNILTQVDELLDKHS